MFTFQQMRESLLKKREVTFMKRAFKNVMKWAPIIYPIVKKFINKRKAKRI